MVGGGGVIKVTDIYGSKRLPIMADPSERLLKLTCALKHSAESGCSDLLFQYFCRKASIDWRVFFHFECERISVVCGAKDISPGTLS